MQLVTQIKAHIEIYSEILGSLLLDTITRFPLIFSIVCKIVAFNYVIYFVAILPSQSCVDKEALKFNINYFVSE